MNLLVTLVQVAAAIATIVLLVVLHRARQRHNRGILEQLDRVSRLRDSTSS